MKTFYKIIASGFGSGFSPFASGTAGSLLACLLAYGFAFCLPESADTYLFSSFSSLLLALIVLSIIFGIISINNLENEWGHDSPKYTIDEIVGMWISLLFVPFTLTSLFVAFILFRFFDILKPFGIRSLEKVHGGWGVILDDVLAGIYANVILHILLFYGLLEYFN